MIINQSEDSVVDASSPLSDDADSGAGLPRIFDKPVYRRAQIAHVTVASVNSEMWRAPGQNHLHKVAERSTELRRWILEPLRFKVTY